MIKGLSGHVLFGWKVKSSNRKPLSLVEVEEILTPRVDVIAVEDDLSLDEVADTFAESGYFPARLPRHH